VLPAFTSLDELLDRLDDAGLRNRVDALAICAHGATMSTNVAGEVHISPVLSAVSLRRAPVARLVRRLADYVRRGGALLFVSCRAGAGPAGIELLVDTSRLLPDRDIKGYVSYGYLNGGWSAVAAGNITDTLLGTVNVPERSGYPRMIEGCASERVARNGRITRWPRIRRMWEQLEQANPDLAERIFDEWLARANSVVRRPRPDFTLSTTEWQRPYTEWMRATSADSVESYYAMTQLDE
jgi:hypothetical protein